MGALEEEIRPLEQLLQQRVDADGASDDDYSHIRDIAEQVSTMADETAVEVTETLDQLLTPVRNGSSRCM